MAIWRSWRSDHRPVSIGALSGHAPPSPPARRGPVRRTRWRPWSVNGRAGRAELVPGVGAGASGGAATRRRAGGCGQDRRSVPVRVKRSMRAPGRALRRLARPERAPLPGRASPSADRRPAAAARSRAARTRPRRPLASTAARRRLDQVGQDPGVHAEPVAGDRVRRQRRVPRRSRRRPRARGSPGRPRRPRDHRPCPIGAPRVLGRLDRLLDRARRRRATPRSSGCR